MEVMQDIVFPAIDERNRVFAQEGEPIKKAPDALIFGKGGPLDSLGLVNFILIVEEKIAEKTGVPVVLADARAVSLAHSPFRDVSLLTSYIEEILKGP